MLREIRATRQRGGEPGRRWFSDEGMDLTVWQAPDGALLAFQLAYDRGGDEHLVEWRHGGGLRHHRVDDGEAETGRYKQTPLLLPDGAIPRRRLVAEFGRRSRELAPELRDSILWRLEGKGA